MGHRAAMRGRRRVSGGCAWVGLLRCWRAVVVVSWGGGVFLAANGQCERATTGMVWSGVRTRRGGWEASERSVECGGGTVQCSSSSVHLVYSRGWSGVTCAVSSSVLWLGCAASRALTQLSVTHSHRCTLPLKYRSAGTDLGPLLFGARIIFACCS